MVDWAALSDEQLTDRLQRAAFSYLIDYADTDTGLVADTSRRGSPCSIAVVGFALSCYPIAVRNGWLSRADGASRTLKVLKFFARSVQSDAPDATGYKGFYYHFLDMQTGKRVWQCELSLIDTALLIVGVLVAGCYFDGGGEESEIRELADALYRRVDWRWAQNGAPGLSQGWKPECGFLHYGWEGFNEATILYVLGLGSPTCPLTESGYVTWGLTYQWEHLLGQDVLYSGPLFTHLFSHAWIDFRGIRDVFMREPRSTYDLAIVGAGPAGLAAAESAARLGFSVALIERNRMGGNSLNVGSVPSKAIIRTARVFGTMRDAEEFGAPVPNEPALQFGKVMARMRRIRTRISEYNSVHDLAALGVDIFFDNARFAGASAFLVGNTRLHFKKALIATGARPRAPDIPGLDQTGYRTSATIFEMAALPKRLAVIGGGPLGCELAQAFCRLGSRVTIVQNDPKFLPREERDAAEILSRSMARDGVEIRLNTTVIGARRAGGAKILKTVNNDVESDIQADEILLSIGRVANVEELELKAAAIEFDTNRGIKVDDFQRSTNPNVYAAGDACLALKFTNAAQSSARLAVQNALMQAQQRQSRLAIPWCTFCDPEIAHIGLHVWEARQNSIPIKSFTVMMHDVDRAITDGQDTGFVKIHIAEGSDKILGATIVASRASELINEMAVIMSAGIGMKALADVVHTYPAQSEAIMLAAQAYTREFDKAAEAAAQRATPGEAADEK
jgi:pyruvate/2-oxoglutarate dehydrogenase complex dihydrolipoamide dehydrogenase (E3) component